MSKRRRAEALEPELAWPGMIGRVGHGDCVPGMQAIPDGAVQLVFADPPFNIGYGYDEYDDQVDAPRYLDWSRTWMGEVRRVLHRHGTFWLAIGDRFVSELDVIAKSLGFHKRGHVCWYYTFGMNVARNFSKSHTHLLYYTRSQSRYTFHEDAVRVPSARQLVYRDKRASPEGRLPDDTWILRPQDPAAGFAPDHDTWHFSRVCGTYKEKAATANQMPEQLLGRIVRVCANPGDLVLDPFAGSGTTAVVAKKLGRKFITFEISAAYVLQANLRLEAARAGDMLDAPEPSPAPPPPPARKRGSRGSAAASPSPPPATATADAAPVAPGGTGRTPPRAAAD